MFRKSSLSTFAVACALVTSCGRPADPTPEELIGESALAVWTPTNCPSGSNVIQGSTGDDVLVGTPADDCILGLSGNDTLSGAGGNDVLVGGPGNDSLQGDDGDDRLLGQAGDDALEGGDGNDQLDGGKGNDVLRGGAGKDVLAGAEGDDVTSGDDGPDYVGGGPGNDEVDGGAGDDRLLGGDGDDHLVGGGGNDALRAGPGLDNVEGGAGEDVLEGGAGDDHLMGGAGLNRIDGGDDTDECGESTTQIRCESAACPPVDLGSVVGKNVARGDTRGATDQMFTACIGPQGAGDALMTWTAPISGRYTFTTVGSDFDTTIQIIRGVSCNEYYPPIELCVDDTPEGVAASVSAAVLAGETITVVIGGYAHSAGEFVLGIVPPAPDTCPNGDLGTAIGDAVAVGTTVGQGHSVDPSCAPGEFAGDLSYTWTAPSDGRFAFDTFGSAFTTTLVLSASCEGPELECLGTPFRPRGPGRIVRTFSAGESILVTVGGAFQQEGDFILNIRPQPPPVCPDGDLGSALGDAVATGTLDPLGPDDRSSSCSAGTPDREYLWTAPSTGTFSFNGRFSTPVKAFVRVSVLDGECGGEELGCGPTTMIEAVAGHVYTVVVEVSSRFATPEFALDIREVTPGVCPSGDLGSATGMFSGTTEGMGSFFEDPFCSGSFGNPDQSFLWTAPSSGFFRIDTDGSPQFVGLLIFDGQCDGSSLVTCGSPAFLQAEEGHVYTIVADTFGAPTGPFNLNILPQTTASCPTGDLGSALGESLSAGVLDGTSSVESYCTAPGSPDASFTWTAPHDGTFQLDTLGSPVDPLSPKVLTLFNGSCSSEQLSSCEQDRPVQFVAVAGQTFTFAIEGAAGTSYVLNVRELPPPECPTDDIGGSLGLGVSSGSLVGAAHLFDATCYGWGAAQAAIVWTAPSDGEFVIDAMGSELPIAVEIQEGACTGALTSCWDRTARLFATAGQVFTIVLTGHGGQQGEYTLNVRPVDPPICPAADLGSAVGPAVASGSTLLAGSAIEPSCTYFVGGGDVSYTWTPPASGRYRISTLGSSFNTILSVREGGCEGAEIACNDDFSYQAASLVEAQLEAGTVYVISVDGYDSGDFTLGIEPALASCPAADLGSAVGESVAVGATGALGNSADVTCNVAAARDSVFLWTPPETGNFVFSVARSNLPAIVALLEGGCGGAELGCGSPEVAKHVVAGQTYGIVVEGVAGFEGDFVLDIRMLPAGVCPTLDLGSSLGSEVATVSTVGGGSAVEPSCRAVDFTSDATLTWTAPATGKFRFTVSRSELGVGAIVAVLDASCGGSELACRFGRAEFDAVEGQVYTIVVEGLYGEDTFTLDAVQMPELVCPASDLGSALGQNVATGSTAGLGSGFEPSCASPEAQADASFSWTAPSDGTFVFDTFGSEFDTTLTLLRGGCEGEVIACNNDFQSWNSRVAARLAAGDVVILVVDGAYHLNEGQFVVSITEAPAGSCPTTELGSAVGPGAGIGNTSGSGTAFEPSCQPQGTSAANDVSFSWIAPRSGTYAFDTFGSELGDTAISILDGRCGGTELSCAWSYLQAEVEGGREYTIVVESIYGADGKFALNIVEL
ncbi:MAG: hypothetical protein HY791_08270 [Deltaproteobacteria bacterium]|nr:hypothetical protein [Deltaproteobacteria bacterium]